MCIAESLSPARRYEGVCVAGSMMCIYDGRGCGRGATLGWTELMSGHLLQPIPGGNYTQGYQYPYYYYSSHTVQEVVTHFI